MAQISRYKMKKEVGEKVGEIFKLSLAWINTKEKAAAYLRSLLTSTERVMLAKRLAIIILERRGYSYDQIMGVLKVSRCTIWSVKKTMRSMARALI